MRASAALKMFPGLVEQLVFAAPNKALCADLASRGFVLTPKICILGRRDGSRRARLVYRHRELDSSVVLTVRL